MIDCVLTIYLSVRWDTSHRRPLYEALARQLKGKANVLCVDRPICPFVTTFTNPVRIGTWFKNRSKPLQLAENLYLLTPWVFLHDQLALQKPILVNLNRKILHNQIEKCLVSICPHPTKRIVWVSDPMMYDWLDLIGENSIIYECFDEYASYPGLSPRQGERIESYESKVLSKADIVLAASKELERNKRREGKSVYFVPNAVEIDHFRKATHKNTPVCEDIAGIKRPIIGFIGGIWGILDLKLLHFVATSQPEWSIVLVGNLSKIAPTYFIGEFNKLKELPNVFWLGWREYTLLPSYLKSMDVCLLPYVLNQWTRNCHPSKLYQYLAAGKPVISTDIPEARPFCDVVRIAKTYESFLSGVAQSLEDNAPESINRRIQVAAQNTWDIRARKIAEILMDHHLVNEGKTNGQC